MRIGKIICILLPALAQAQFTQQGGKLVGTGAAKTQATCTTALGSSGLILSDFRQGYYVGLSADGNTMIESSGDDLPAGAAWIFTRSNGAWSQQGSKLVGSNAQGTFAGDVPVAISADGNTAVMGISEDNGGTGALWFFTRSNGVWSQQGPKIVGTGATSSSCKVACTGAAQQGFSVALSADGNTAITGGPTDFNNGLDLAGAAWIFTRTSGVWSQQGNKLVGSGVDPFEPSLANDGAFQGQSVAISADGNTAVVGGNSDGALGTGAVWIFTRTNGVWSQQGNKLVGTGAVGPADVGQGSQVAISGDGTRCPRVAPAMVTTPPRNTALWARCGSSRDRMASGLSRAASWSATTSREAPFHWVQRLLRSHATAIRSSCGDSRTTPIPARRGCSPDRTASGLSNPANWSARVRSARPFKASPSRCRLTPVPWRWADPRTLTARSHLGVCAAGAGPRPHVSDDRIGRRQHPDLHGQLLRHRRMGEPPGRGYPHPRRARWTPGLLCGVRSVWSEFWLRPAGG
ncbi:exported hypothetical protein [Candidatus Sulfopaludibacter sp. SbA4]|nr:exported hypothetical protein [Candidatus Sulfopaludibacter sp. SbA4]